MPDPHTHSSRPGLDVSKMSIWTVVGAVAASVLAAGILGGASGIMQIPSMVNDLKTLNDNSRTSIAAAATQSERLRSQELGQEALQRQLNILTARLEAMNSRQDKKDAEDRTTDIQTQRDIAALEGRSKDRHTEVVGATNALRSGIDGLGDRLRLTAEAQNVIRQQIYDLATRTYKREIQQALPLPQSPSTPPYSYPPPLNNSDRNEQPRLPPRVYMDTSTPTR